MSQPQPGPSDQGEQFQPIGLKAEWIGWAQCKNRSALWREPPGSRAPV